MIFQDALAALNPVSRSASRSPRRSACTTDVDKDALRERAIELLDLVGIPQPERARRRSTRTSSRAVCASGR